MMESIRPVPHGWEYASSFGLTMRVDRLAYASRGLHAWIEVRPSAGPVVDGEAPAVFGQWNLLANTAAPAIARRVDQYLIGPSDNDRKPFVSDWVGDVIYDVIRRWREGPEPSILRGESQRTANDWLLEPFVERRAHSRLIAAGGSGKSYIALAMGLTVSTGERFFPRRVADPTLTGPVAYLDWESDRETHDQRMRQLMNGSCVGESGEGIVYFPMRGPLHSQASGIQRRIEQTGSVMAIVDSVMLARGSSGEGGAEDSTVRLFEALDELAVPCLLIDHKSKAQVKSRSGLGGYGSVVMTNSVRNEWDAYQVYHGDNSIRIGMKHTKQNNTGRYKDLALSLNFDSPGAVRLTGSDSVTETFGDLPVADQLRVALADGPATIKELADVTEERSDTIGTTLRRNDSHFVRVAKVGNADLWGLVGQEYDVAGE